MSVKWHCLHYPKLMNLVKDASLLTASPQISAFKEISTANTHRHYPNVNRAIQLSDSKYADQHLLNDDFILISANEGKLRA